MLEKNGAVSKRRFIFRRFLMHPQKKKRFYSKLWESFLCRTACENPVGLSINEKHEKTVEYTRVNIWYMFH